MKNKTETALWNIFSKYVRARDANYQGYCRCISCSTVKNWKEFDAGHFVPVGSDRALKYNEMNVNTQCRSCNSFKSGNLIHYRLGIVRKYGEKKVKELERSHFFKTTKKKLNQLEINALYIFYKNELKKLESKKCL